MDTLIAQLCLRYELTLLTIDADFRRVVADHAPLLPTAQFGFVAAPAESMSVKFKIQF